jgi:hypothetical protein
LIKCPIVSRGYDVNDMRWVNYVRENSIPVDEYKAKTLKYVDGLGADGY